MLLSEPVRAWFGSAFPEGPTPGQELAWPPIAAGENVLLVAPTGTGKTLAAFLAVLDRLFREREAGTLAPGLRCVYVSPLRSLNYDIERNLAAPLAAIARRLELERNPIKVGVRTGDTSAYERRKLRDDPPHVLITTPESLSLLLSQAAWQPHWKGVEHLIVDEVHALAPTKRGADLAVSLERLAAQTDRDPRRIGLSATTHAEPAVVQFLAGASRDCRVIVAPPPPGTPTAQFDVESLIRPGESPNRGQSYRRLLRRLHTLIDSQRTTVVFANTRALAEKVTHDLRAGRSGVWSRNADEPAGRPASASLREGETPAEPLPSPGSPARTRTLKLRRFREGETPAEPPQYPGSPGGSPSREGNAFADDMVIAAHHSALDVQRRRAIESGLKSGELRAVVTSTSLELGVDIGTADLAVQIGLPGGVSRCLQRVGRSGHRRGAGSRGILLAATPAELVGAAVTARAARDGRLEPLRVPSSALDVVCQQLVGMACAGEQSVDAAFDLLKRSGPMAALSREDFNACLAFLAGELGAPAGAYESEPGAAPRWTSPRIWRRNGWFGLRSGRVARWFRLNVGTILSEESVRVVADGRSVGTLEAAYAERLTPGDRFVLDGRSLEVRRLEGSVVHARVSGGEPSLPRWTSDRQSLSRELAAELAALRAEAAQRLDHERNIALVGWLADEFALDRRAAAVIAELVEAQERYSEVPSASGLLVEESPAPEGSGLAYAFHAPLHRSACEAMARAIGARLGRRFGRNLTLAVADLGWSIQLPEGARLSAEEIVPLIDPGRLDEDVLEGLDRGELLARRFRSVAATALMVLRNPEPGRRVRVGGMNWVSTRLYPLVQAACPDHPLLRQTRREVLEDFLDVPAAAGWLASQPPVRFRSLHGISPFTAAWIEPGSSEALQFESPGDALRRLHARLTAAAKGAGP